MKVRTVLYVIAAVLLGLVIAANWSLFTTQVELNFLAVRMQAPLAVLLLLVAAVIVLLDLSIHMASRLDWMRERRVLKNDLDAARLRAEREDESRIGTLRTTVERELAGIHAQLDRLIEGQSALLSSSFDERVVDDLSPLDTRAASDPRASVDGRATVHTRPAVDTRMAEARRHYEPELVPPRTVGDGRGA